jgi:helix-turn-helix protein
MDGRMQDVTAPQVGFPPASSSPRSFGNRWKHDELFTKGYVGLPVTFLHHYALLNPPLNAGEALFVIHLMQFKWDEQAPFPGYKKIAAQMGVSDKMARRHAQSLEIKGYLTREERIGRTNRFHLTGLFDALLKASQARTS